MSTFYAIEPYLPDPDYEPVNEGFIPGMYAIYKDSLVNLYVTTSGREMAHIIHTNDNTGPRIGESFYIDSKHDGAPVPAVEQDWHDRRMHFSADSYQTFDTDTYKDELSSSLRL